MVWTQLLQYGKFLMFSNRVINWKLCTKQSDLFCPCLQSGLCIEIAQCHFLYYTWLFYIANAHCPLVLCVFYQVNLHCRARAIVMEWSLCMNPKLSGLCEMFLRTSPESLIIHSLFLLSHFRVVNLEDSLSACIFSNFVLQFYFLQDGAYLLICNPPGMPPQHCLNEWDLGNGTQIYCLVSCVGPQHLLVWLWHEHWTGNTQAQFPPHTFTLPMQTE